MKKHIKSMYLHWFLVLLMCLSSLLVYYQYSLIRIILALIIFVRLLKSHNKQLIIISAILSSILLLRAMTIDNELTKLENLPLQSLDSSIILSIDPLSVDVREDSIRALVPAYIKLNGSNFRLQVDMIYWVNGEIPGVEKMFQQSAYLTVQGDLSLAESARNFDVFDYKDYLASQEIIWMLEIKSIDHIQENHNLLGILNNIRFRIVKFLSGHNNSYWLALYNKLIWNVNSNSYQDFKEHFVDLGVVHLFAISGFHIYYLRRTLNYILLRIGLRVETSGNLIAILLFIYIWLIQWPIGALRVLIMHFILSLQRKYHWPISKIDTLALVALCLIIFNPLNILSVAFILSFLMTSVINFYQTNSHLRNTNIDSLKITVLCLLFSWPIIISMSHQWNILQALWIIIFTFLFNRFIMPLMLLTLLVTNLSIPAKELFISLVDYFLQFIYQSLENHSFDFFLINTRNISEFVYILLVATAIYFLVEIHKKPLKAFIIPLFIYAGVFVLMPYLDPRITLTIIDVGQGDAMILQLAHNKGNWLIDTGGRRDWVSNDLDMNYAYRNIIPSLQALGVNTIDGLIISHADTDHMGNLQALIEEFTIEFIYLNQFSSDSELWSSMREELNSINIQIIEQGESYHKEQVGIRIFSAPEELVRYSNSLDNDASLMSIIEIADLTVLTLGDVSKEIEEKVVLDYLKDTPIDILKLAHHGSDSSSSELLLQTIQPKLAIVSAGYNNSYGHPHSDVIERLRNNNIPYLSTHEQGAIQIVYHPLFGYSVKTKFN